jgi:hypothetical protein
MTLPSCEECKAIHQELLRLIEVSHRSKPGPNATPQQLAAWFDQRDDDEDQRLRWRPALSNLRRRFTEHQELTGHTIPLPLPHGGLTSQN